jgi:hypothetical protein
MSKRLLGVITLVLLLSCTLLAGTALAVEEEDGPPEHQELPTIDEIGTGSETAEGFRPEPYEQPSVFPAFIFPLMLGALVLLLIALVLYLVWQPRFAEERKQKARR